MRAPLDYRNVVEIDGGRFDCEINHPDFGWIPFTADPDDVEPHGRGIWTAIEEQHQDTPKPEAHHAAI